jgi:hypothetical protein
VCRKEASDRQCYTCVFDDEADEIAQVRGKGDGGREGVASGLCRAPAVCFVCSCARVSRTDRGRPFASPGPIVGPPPPPKPPPASTYNAVPPLLPPPPSHLQHFHVCIPCAPPGVGLHCVPPPSPKRPNLPGSLQGPWLPAQRPWCPHPPKGVLLVLLGCGAPVLARGVPLTRDHDATHFAARSAPVPHAHLRNHVGGGRSGSPCPARDWPSSPPPACSLSPAPAPHPLHSHSCGTTSSTC